MRRKEIWYQILFIDKQQRKMTIRSGLAKNQVQECQIVPFLIFVHFGAPRHYLDLWKYTKECINTKAEKLERRKRAEMQKKAGKGGKGGFGYAISLSAKIVSKRTTGHRVP